MTAIGFQPTLGNILEESTLSSTFDDSLLDEYAVLSDHDLLEALDLHANCGECTRHSIECASSIEEERISNENDDTSGNECASDSGDFAMMHKDTMFKNQIILNKYSVKPDIDKHLVNVSFDQETPEKRDSEVIALQVTEAHPSSRNFALNPLQTLNNNANVDVCSHDNVFNTVTCVDFKSDLGKKVFMRAVNHKYMNIYYVLSVQHIIPLQFHNEGISTLAMISIALKSNYDFTLHKASQTLDFDEFACLSRDVGFSVQVIRISKGAAVEDFRKAVKLSTSSSNSVIVCNYIEDQFCTGHFSIITGFCKDRDLLLLVDVKSTTKWMPLQEMWNILSKQTKTDQNLGHKHGRRANGYLVVEKASETPYITVSISHKASIKLESQPGTDVPQKLLGLNKKWEDWLDRSAVGSGEDTLKSSIKLMIGVVTGERFFESKREISTSNEATKLQYKQGSLVDSVTRTRVFSIVQTIISSASSEDLNKMNQFAEWIFDVLFVTRTLKHDKNILSKGIRRKKKTVIKTRVDASLFNNTAMLSTWLIFWPYKKKPLQLVENTNSLILQEFLDKDLKIFPVSMVQLFHEQINFVLKALNPTFIS